MTYRVGPQMRQANELCNSTHGVELKTYLKDQINRGRSDTALAKEFGVNRHTVRNWQKLLGIQVVKRALNK